MDITWHPEARAEFDAYVDCYDGREVGLGARFEGDVLSAVDAAADSPEAWPKWPDWDREPPSAAAGVDADGVRWVPFPA